MTTSEKAKVTSAKLGSTIEVPEGAKVQRPDGFGVTVSGGLYVLTQTGSYDVDGQEYSVK